MANINTNYYNWLVPNPGGTRNLCYIRATVTDSSSPPASKNDTSDSNFTIYVTPPKKLTLTLLIPNGGENWTAGLTYDITWKVNGTPPISLVKLEYSTTGVTGSYTMITDSADCGIFNWQIPLIFATSTDCYIRANVSDGTGQNDSVTNPAPFTIWAPPEPNIDINSPNGGETWIAGSTHTIKWTVTGGYLPILVRLKYTTQGAGGSYSDITPFQVNGTTGKYDWVVPDTPSVNCFVYAIVTDSYGASGRTDEDKSSSAFTIEPPPPPLELGVISPGAGDTLIEKDSYDILWNRSGGVSPYTTIIQFTGDGGGTYTDVTATAPDNGASSIYAWTVPSVISGECYIRVNVTDGAGQSLERLSGKFGISRLDTRGGIDGYIEIENGLPAENATVLVVGTAYSKTSTNLGYFEIKSIPAGTYTIRVSKEGYEDATVDNITVKSSNTTSVGTIKLQKKQPIDQLPQWMIIGIGAGAGIGILMLLLLLVFGKRKSEREAKERPAPIWVDTAMLPRRDDSQEGGGAALAQAPVRGSGSLPPDRKPKTDEEPVYSRGFFPEEQPDMVEESAPVMEESPATAAKPKEEIEEVDEDDLVAAALAQAKRAARGDDGVPVAKKTAGVKDLSQQVKEESPVFEESGPEMIEIDMTVATQLQKLDEMRAQGVITDEEYEINRKRLLNI
jgi:hypothetical protein